MDKDSINSILSAVTSGMGRSGGGGGGGGGRSGGGGGGGGGGGPDIVETRTGDIEERLKALEATQRNGRAWRPNHRLERVRTLIREPPPESRRGGGDKKGEWKWLSHPDFPKTVLQFKELQYHPRKVRSMLDFYACVVYFDDDFPEDSDDARDFEPRRVETRRPEKLREVEDYMEPCMESLAMAWGLNWKEINGLRMPSKPERRSGGGGGGASNGGGGGGGGGNRQGSRPPTRPTSRGGQSDAESDGGVEYGGGSSGHGGGGGGGGGSRHGDRDRDRDRR